LNSKRTKIIIGIVIVVGLIIAGLMKFTNYLGPSVTSDVYEAEVVALEYRYISPAKNSTPQYFIHYNYGGIDSAIEVTEPIFQQTFVGQQVRIQGDSVGLYGRK
jgi:hypothetical protein